MIVQFLGETLRARRLIWDLARADFRKRFVGSYFGVVWMFVQPVVTVLIYFMIFQLGFKSAPPIPGVPYVLWLVPGIVPWFFFNEALNAGTACLQEYHYLVKKVVFNVEVLPVIKLVSCAVVHAIFVAIMIGMFFCYGRLPMATWVQLLYYSFALSVNILAVTLFTTAINVFFKDMAQIVSICLQFGMWLIPIMWAPEMFPGFPARLQQLLKLNPVYYVVTGYRDSMLAGNWFWERPMQSVYYWVVTLLLLYIGLRVFRRLRPHFPDVL
nr:ABC transporter permease [Moryella indoligenes]